MSIRLPSAVNNKKKRDEGSNRWSSICGSSPHWNCPVCTLKLWPETVWNKNHQAKYLMLNLLQSCLNQNDQKMAWKFHRQWDRTPETNPWFFYHLIFIELPRACNGKKNLVLYINEAGRAGDSQAEQLNWFVFPSPYKKNHLKIYSRVKHKT